MNQQSTNPSAWRDPWLPVTDENGQPQTVSLRTAFEHAHQLRGLGAALTPLDRDSLYRFLPALGAVIARAMPESAQDAAERFSTSALDAFASDWEDSFDLTGERPFLQRWDKTQSDLADLPKAKQALPLTQLHPHEPGEKSSQWAVRLGTVANLSWPHITLLLVTAWFQTRNGNGRDPWGGKMSKGSAATWHTRPLALYYTNESSLIETIFANMPQVWLDRDDLPVFLDHAAFTPQLAATPASQTESVARFTYAKSIPLIQCVDGVPRGFVIGPDATIPVPPLGKDDKDSLGLVHAGDHTRLYVDTGKNSDEKKPRGAFESRISTTGGLGKWADSENQVERAMTAWEGLTRAYPLPHGSRGSWKLSILTDVGDTQGNRQWAAWDEVPLTSAAPDPAARNQLKRLLDFARDLRSRYFSIGRSASDGAPPTWILTGQSAFYSRIYPRLIQFLGEAANAKSGEALPESRLHEIGTQIYSDAIRGFEAATEPLLTPSQTPQVAKARAEYSRSANQLFRRAFPDSPTEREAA